MRFFMSSNLGNKQLFEDLRTLGAEAGQPDLVKLATEAENATFGFLYPDPVVTAEEFLQVLCQLATCWSELTGNALEGQPSAQDLLDMRALFFATNEGNGPLH